MNLFDNYNNNNLYLRKNKFHFIIVLIILIYIIKSFKYEHFCLECINEIKSDKCNNCKINAIFRNIKIYDEDETLDEIIYKNKSISRYGDGEFKLVLGSSKEKKLLVGINLPYKLKNLNRLNPFVKNLYKEWFQSYKFKLAKILKNRKYYSSTISRFYIDLKSKKRVKKYIKKLKMIWDHKEIVIIEGEQSRLGIGNDLFNNTISIQRILCPILNAFNRYKEIINTIKNKVNKNKLILIALGPTATVLSYDLYKLGYQAIDIGHADIEYEWYLRKVKTKIPIKNKYVNERRKSQKKITKIADKNYYRQIIAKIYD